MSECDNDAFGTQVPVTCYAYDEGGRQNTVWNPDGTVTTTEYDGLGRVLLVTENVGGDATDLDGVRRTAHSYDQYGRLELMAAVDTMNNSGTVSSWASIDWEATDGTIQITSFEYGADVLDKSGVKISEHNGWIREVRYPDPSTGQPSELPSLSFEYYSDGSVASREDEKGNRFVYHYDEQGRLVQTDVSGSRWYATGANQRYDPPPPIKTITYSYTPDGLPETVTAYDGEDATGNILSQSTFEYDALRHLTKESQSHGGAVTTGTPAITYAWDSSPQGSGTYNYDRLVGMTYPTRPETGARSLGFNYGAGAGDVDSLLNRITAIVRDPLGTPVTEAAYAYMGTSRRVTAAANAVAATTAARTAAGFGARGTPLIVDTSLSIGANQLAAGLRQLGYNARSILEMSGEGVDDIDILVKAREIGARVITSDVGHNILGGFGGYAISVPQAVRQIANVVWYLNEAGVSKGG